MKHRKQTWTFLLMTVLLALVLSGCGKKQPPPPPPPPPAPKPVTATLTANPSTIERGQSATLTWSTENADDVNLDGAKVDANGSKTVSPTTSTNYQLSAKGPGGTQGATARVTVTQPPPPPPPPPPPSDDVVFNQNVRDIFFDYDKFDLRTESQQALTQAAQTISQHSNWVVLIEGNCDERGSIEYNQALGQNRATSARDFLVKAGVNANQLRTVSYGKEKPVCTESNEDCWQKNRHDHFVLQH